MSYKLSLRLKVVTAVLAALCVLFFLAICLLRGYLDFGAGRRSVLPLLFAGVAAVCCLKILWHFWYVCTEIGNGNSFSEENEQLFRKMALTGRVIAGIYGVRTVTAVVTLLMNRQQLSGPWSEDLFAGAVTDLAATAFAILMTVAFVLFAIIADALAKLIGNAYEVKRENELTI